MSATQPDTRIASDVAAGRRLVEHLNSLVTTQNLGALALLRRGLGRRPGETPELFTQVLPYLAPSEAMNTAQREREEDAALLVASLYAFWHQGKATPRPAQKVSLGAAFLQLAKKSGSDSIEPRFVALLKASHERLPDHLRHAIALLKAQDIPLDWALLLRDLSQWDEANRRAQHPVRRRWARDFWERARMPEDEAATQSGADIEKIGEEGEGEKV